MTTVTDLNREWRRWSALLALLCVACGGGSAASTGLPSTFAGTVVFVRTQGGGNTLMVMNADGSDVRSLPVQGLKPDVSPDGHRVAYQRDENIYVFDLATGDETLVASAGVDVGASWSPDGSRILFWSDRSGKQNLWVVDPDGSNAVRLTDDGGYLEGDWSPDGSRIVCRRNTGDGGDLWVMDADGSHQEVLSSLPGQEGNPQWSPDGAHIAFDWVARSGAATSVGVYVIDARGSDPVRVSAAGVESWAPRWSPDSGRILFFAYPSSPDDADLYSAGTDGTDLAPLLSGPTYDDGGTFGPERR